MFDPNHQLFRDRRPVDPERTAAARVVYPWLPGSYWEFLEQIGSGDFGGLMFAEVPFPIEEVARCEGPTGFVAFAHDPGGMFYGFHPKASGVCGVDSATWVLEELELGFEELVGQMMAAGEV